MKKILFVALVVLGVGVPYIIWSKFTSSHESTETTSGIVGTVLLGPICPVVQDPPDPGCADKPYASRLVLTTADQARIIHEFVSDVNGRFRVQIKPGEYAIRSAVASNIWPYCSSSNIIKVMPNNYTETVVNCDTGIR